MRDRKALRYKVTESFSIGATMIITMVVLVLAVDAIPGVGLLQLVKVAAGITTLTALANGLLFSGFNMALEAKRELKVAAEQNRENEQRLRLNEERDEKLAQKVDSTAKESELWRETTAKELRRSIGEVSERDFGHYTKLLGEITKIKVRLDIKPDSEDVTPR